MSDRLRYTGLVVFLLALTVSGCQKKKSISGDAFIEREVFVKVLVDIHLMDGVTQDRKFSRKYDVDSVDVFSPILEKYHVSRQMFDTTMYEYSRYPELLDEVYNDVLIQLNVMLDENSREEEASSIEEE